MPNFLHCARGALLQIVLLISSLLVCSSAFAVLGQDIASVQSDGAHLKAAVRILPGRNYLIHELRATSGTAVKKIVFPPGDVFGGLLEGAPPPQPRPPLRENFCPKTQTGQTERHPGPPRADTQ